MQEPRPMYRLPELVAADMDTPIYIVEGEKCVSALVNLGLNSTTSAGGAMAAVKTDWAPLAGRTVHIAPDNDSAGRAYSDAVAKTLRGLTPAATVNLVELGGLAEGEDCYDWLQRRPDHESLEATIEIIRAAAKPYPDTESPDAAADDLKFFSAASLIKQYPNLRPYVIDRIQRRGEIMNLIAAPKIGKSWLLMALLLGIATGTHWLGCPCQMGRVLLLDNELHGETLAKRILVVADALGISLADLGDRLSIVSLRGKSKDLATLKRTFDNIKPGEYAMIAIDALYRALPRDCEENSNENMRDVYNLLDLYAEQTGAAFELVHHSSKGDQSQKSITDIGSGAGAISRAADVHCIIRAHEQADCAVLDCRIRSGAQPAPLGLRWNYPLWVPDSTLDVEALASTTRRKKAGTEPELKANYMTVANIALPEPKPLAFFTAKTCLNQMNCRRYLAEAVEVGALHLWSGRTARDPQRWATEPPDLRAAPCV